MNHDAPHHPEVPFLGAAFLRDARRRFGAILNWDWPNFPVSTGEPNDKTDQPIRPILKKITKEKKHKNKKIATFDSSDPNYEDAMPCPHFRYPQLNRLKKSLEIIFGSAHPLGTFNRPQTLQNQLLAFDQKKMWPRKNFWDLKKMTANFQIHTNDMAQRENNKEHNTQNDETKHEKNTQETNNAKTHRSYTIATKSPMI